MSQRIIYWFRNDLRLYDNEGFHSALNTADEVIPVYVFDPRQFSKTKFGFRRMSALRVRFLLETVSALRARLREKGSDLLIRIGEPEKIVAQLADDFGASYVYTSKEIAPDETYVESSLSKRLKVSNIDIRLFWMNTLGAVSQLPFPIAKLPRDFETFYDSVKDNIDVNNLFPEADQINFTVDYTAGSLPTLPILGIDPNEINETQADQVVTGGEVAARKELEQFIQNHISDQNLSRSADMLMESQLTKWISLGCLSPRIVLQYTRTNTGSTTVLRALLRRDYFQWTLLKHGPRLFKPGGISHDMHASWSNDLPSFDRYRSASTENEEINGLIKKLNDTGYLTFEERITAASYLAGNLNINWTWGAAYFESMLLDYNVSNSWCNWNYVAGVAGNQQ